MVVQTTQPVTATQTEESLESEPQRYLFTLDQYERMIEIGILREDERLELIRGEIVEMTPIGVEHGLVVAKLNRLLNKLVDDQVLVWVQSAIQIAPANARPEPDLTLLRWRDDYDTSKPPTASDVLLVVEVADTSLNYDRTVKAPLYAQAGIPEYWLVNLPKSVIEIYTNPTEGSYKQTKRARRGETLPLPGGLQGAIQVNDILGEASKK